jgi:hypothetical protein
MPDLLNRASAQLDKLGVQGAMASVKLRDLLALLRQRESDILTSSRALLSDVKASATKKAIGPLGLQVSQALEVVSSDIKEFLRTASLDGSARQDVLRLLRLESARFHDTLIQLLQGIIDRLAVLGSKGSEKASLAPGLDKVKSVEETEDEAAVRRDALVQLGQTVLLVRRQRVFLDTALRDPRFSKLLLSPSAMDVAPLYIFKGLQFLAAWASLRSAIRVAPRNKSMTPVLAYFLTAYLLATLVLLGALTVVSRVKGLGVSTETIFRTCVDSMCTSAMVALGSISIAHVIEHNKYFQIRSGDTKPAREAFSDIMLILVFLVLLVPFGLA